MKKLLFTAICAMAFTNGFAEDNNTKDETCGALAVNYAGGNNFIELINSMKEIYDACMESTPLDEMIIDKTGDN